MLLWKRRNGGVVELRHYNLPVRAGRLAQLTAEGWQATAADFKPPSHAEVRTDGQVFHTWRALALPREVLPQTTDTGKTLLARARARAVAAAPRPRSLATVPQEREVPVGVVVEKDWRDVVVSHDLTQYWLHELRGLKKG